MVDGNGAGQSLLTDRALRQSMKERGAWANGKPIPNRKAVPAFSQFLYRYRNLIERFFNNANISGLSSPASKSMMPTTSRS